MFLSRIYKAQCSAVIKGWVLKPVCTYMHFFHRQYKYIHIIIAAEVEFHTYTHTPSQTYSLHSNDLHLMQLPSFTKGLIYFRYTQYALMIDFFYVNKTTTKS